MEGYRDTTYGDAFADVYDDWYGGVSDIAATVTALARLCPNGPARVLELGVGTGRLAIPLATANPSLTVVGIDASEAMLARLRERDSEGLVDTRLGHMVNDLPDGPFDLVFVAYNTLFNLTADGQQRACFAAVAERLAGGGRFVVEAFVPDDPPRDGDDVAIRSMSADRVVLSLSRHDASTGTAHGHFVELSEDRGVRLRPWSIRYSTPAQLDGMAADAGLTLEARWEDAAGSTFDDHSSRHVSVYRRAATSVQLV